jgi:bifunctional DNA-binding transcriptional regulator/antitoxin component of YhaV-PrlF toxin-antitoxin module
MPLIVMSNNYQIRVDEAVRVPKEIQDLLNWKIGDELIYSIDIENRVLILSKKER